MLRIVSWNIKQSAKPWPDELPPDSKNVPTFRTRINQPETATRQLDFVFASEALKDHYVCGR